MNKNAYFLFGTENSNPLLRRHDSNGDSVLDLSEFTALILEIDANTDESEVSYSLIFYILKDNNLEWTFPSTDCQYVQ